VGQPYRAENPHFIFYCCQRVILQHISKTMAATPPTPPISFIPSEDIELSQEERITLAHARWNEASAANENPSQAKLARQYEIPSSTLWNRINDRMTAAARNQQFQRLSPEEEAAIRDWILRLQAWGWSPRVKQVRSIAKELLIKKNDDKSVEVNWSQKFLKRHSQIKTVYISSLDKERAMTQNHDILADWFNLFQSLKEEHEIEIENIYNMNEKRFMQRVIAKLQVMIFKYEKKTHMIQCDNQKWVSLIECISMNERVLKSWIIFKEKVQQKIWYEVLKEDHIAVSENDWIDNELSLVWIQKCFDSETKICQKDEYQMLLIDDHASHITTQMIDYCISQKIILLCLLTYTTHLLQSLDVEVFASLATAYKTHVQRVTQLEISYSIDKTNFLKLYQLTWHETITSLNIRKSWTATELLSFSSVLILQHFSSVKKLEQSQQYNIVIHSTTSFEATVTYINFNKDLEVVLTSANISQVQQLIKQAIEESTSDQILQKMSKAAIWAMTKSTIQNVINQKLLELNRRKKQKISWIENNYDTARVMNQEIVDERRENQQAKIWQKKINSLLRLDSELFTSKSSSIRKWAVIISAQQTKLWNREINDLLRLDSELFTSISMTASFSQKKKKQLIVKLQVRQLKQKQKQKQKQLIVKLWVRQLKQKQKQKQNQKQKQRNNEISTNDQSEQGMHIRRTSKRFY